jgi:4-alpha-glucanotransferase
MEHAMKPAELAKSPLHVRSSGILLHPTSLPGPFGIGDLGPAARTFVDLLESAGQTWWQMLPLQPPGSGYSPYQCYSAFAGNPLLISPDDLRKDGLLKNLPPPMKGPASRVDYPRAETLKRRLLEAAWERYAATKPPKLRVAFEQFQHGQKDWLPDYVLFTALAERLGTHAWQDWPRPLARRDPVALRAARAELGGSIARHTFQQFLFFRQLERLRAYAAERGVRFLADLPIFVSAHSADVWTDPHLFQLDPRGHPRVVAGVPPDAFCADGQRWGNPLYDWDAMRRDRFRWWIRRLRAVLRDADAVRIDHFRGFAACWTIPANSPTARRGKWVKAPGVYLLQAVRRTLGDLPLVAEDLGVITPDVEELRDRFELPGMRIVQFAFDGGPANPHLPFNHVPNSLVYTGTHDNATTRGWFGTLTTEQKKALAVLVPDVRQDPARALLRAAWLSVARIAIAPLQDVLRLGREARMNVPGKPKGNWRWRWSPTHTDEAAFEWLLGLTQAAGRAAPGAAAAPRPVTSRCVS